MRKITAEDLRAANPCSTDNIVVYVESGCEDIDWSKVIEIKKFNTNIEWFVKNVLKQTIKVGDCLYEYDERGNLVYRKDSDKFEEWFEFDEQNHEVHYRNSNKFEEWHEFDERNNVVHYRNSTNYEYWYEFDERNNLVYFKNSNGFEYWQDFDEYGNLIYYKNSSGNEQHYTIPTKSYKHKLYDLKKLLVYKN